MQEFSSISVSTYEAGTLAEKLTGQARDGWSVVAIVPTGSTVTAYLSRTADGAAAAGTDEEGTTVVTPTGVAVGAAVAGNDDTGPDDTGPDDTGPDDTGPDENGTDDVTDGADGVTSDPVTEAPGWAAGAAATTAPEDTPDTPAADSAETTAVAADTAAPAAGAAPAGWYADPSSRFELRYWDGGQWTEHVSRAGQQYTDPPVA